MPGLHPNVHKIKPNPYRTHEERQADEVRKREVLTPLAHQVLTRARDLLSDRERWTYRAMARDAQGRPSSPNDPNAERFCALGAIERASSEVWVSCHIPGYNEMDLAGVAQRLAYRPIMDAAKAITGRTRMGYYGDTSIPAINDHADHGGYAAVITGLLVATGVTPSVAEATLAYQAKQTEDRRAAALKGWRNRRAARKQREAQEEAANTPMVFGGTLPTATPGAITISTAAVSEVTA